MDWSDVISPPEPRAILHLGTRFDDEGVVLPEHGNTAVAQVFPGFATEAALTDLRAARMALPTARHFACTASPS